MTPFKLGLTEDHTGERRRVAPYYVDLSVHLTDTKRCVAANKQFPEKKCSGQKMMSSKYLSVWCIFNFICVT